MMVDGDTTGDADYNIYQPHRTCSWSDPTQIMASCQAASSGSTQIGSDVSGKTALTCNDYCEEQSTQAIPCGLSVFSADGTCKIYQ